MSTRLRQLLGLVLIGSGLAVAPTAVTTAGAAPSAGCTAVNNGAWNVDVQAPVAVAQDYATFEFDQGDTISVSITVSSSGTNGGGSFHVFDPLAQNYVLSVSSGFGPMPATVFTGVKILPASGAYGARAGANNGPFGLVTMTSNVTCTPAPVACAPGSFSPTGSTPCTPAPAGQYVDTASALVATPCPIGTYQPNVGASSCLLASPGSYVGGTGWTQAVQCSPGYYQPNSAGITCLAADPGSYVGGVGAVAATKCVPGQYQAFSAMTSCVVAEPGSYVDSLGATAPTPCPAGYYQPASGATSCLAAQPGFFVPNTGSAAQSPCPPGTTSDAAAVTCRSLFVFSGFRAPVDLPPTLNSAKAGQTIPLKFTVTTSTGAPVTTLTSVSVSVTSLSCNLGASIDPIEEYSAGDTGLQNLGGGQYQFNWKTPKTYASSCKTLRLDLGDGAAHTALFSFQK